MSGVFSSPSDGCVLLVDVPMEPLMVHKSVGENSGSLIGPRRVNGFRIVESDWSIPKFKRYNYKTKIYKTEQ